MAKQKETKGYLEVIEWAEEELEKGGPYSIDVMVGAIAFIYGKTEESVRISLTVKSLQRECLKQTKTLKEEQV